MPSFITDVKVETEVEAEISFEVYCTCGEGICNNTTTRKSRTRNEDQIVIEPCEKCLQKAREENDDLIAELRQEIENLKQEVDRAQNR